METSSDSLAGDVAVLPCRELPKRDEGSAGPSTDWLLLIPDGDVESTQGGFSVDEESARMLIAEFVQRGNDIPIDYEHQTVGGKFAREDGKALAAGWIRELKYDAGTGILGRVWWTEQAASEIGAGQYRYFSPVIGVDPSSSQVVVLFSVALTNTPAISSMPAITKAFRALFIGEPDTVPQQVSDAMRLSAGATTEDIVAAINKLQSVASERGEAVVLKRELESAKSKVSVLKREVLVTRADEAIAKYNSQGKMTFPMVEYERAWLLAEPELFEDRLELFHHRFRLSPVIIPQGRTTAPPRSTGLRGEERDQVMRDAAYLHNESIMLQKMTSKTAFINSALQDEGLDPLSSEEQQRWKDAK